MKTEGKILGVDYGDVRTGIAVSDVTGFLASGIDCVQCRTPERCAELVAEIARKNEVCRVVVGNPLNMNGSAGPRSAAVAAFAQLLRDELGDVPVELLDERLTTVEAHRLLNDTNTRGKKRKAAIDALAAELILQQYLDRERNRKDAVPAEGLSE